MVETDKDMIEALQKELSQLQNKIEGLNHSYDLHVDLRHKALIELSEAVAGGNADLIELAGNRCREIGRRALHLQLVLNRYRNRCSHIQHLLSGYDREEEASWGISDALPTKYL